MRLEGQHLAATELLDHGVDLVLVLHVELSCGEGKGVESDDASVNALE